MTLGDYLMSGHFQRMVLTLLSLPSSDPTFRYSRPRLSPDVAMKNRRRAVLFPV